MSILVTDVEAGYVSGVNILDGISIKVADKEVVSIIGPNGSGKSTLLKTVMGLLVQRTGQVIVDGEDTRGVPVHRRARHMGLAYVPQSNNVFGPLTIRENLELGGQHLSRAPRRTRADEMLELYPNLSRKPTARADSLSGGERQMLALARALMTRPRHLLLDEPSAGLSPRLTSELFDDITRVRDREKVTVLLVEQNAMQSLRVSDRCYVLVQGKTVRSGSAQDILNDPQISELYLGGRPEAVNG
jgi:branched-chain amino acid transport system ATP-binding protein